MTDDRPARSARKLSPVAPIVIGGVFVALLVVAVLIGRPGEQAAPKPSEPEPAAVTAPVELPVRPASPLTRMDMIQSAAMASAAYADRRPAPDELVRLRGRRFQVRLPFGCAGAHASPPAAQVSVERDPSGRSVKLVARTGGWGTLPPIQNLPTAPEAVEGFWLPRPWAFSETCPRPAPMVTPATPTPAATPTLGLARIFAADGSRVLRRDGRPYEFVRKITPEQGSEAYALVLEGRIATLPDGRSIRCYAESPDHRPICLYAVEFDRVAFETEDGALLAEWRE